MMILMGLMNKFKKENEESKKTECLMDRKSKKPIQRGTS